MTPDIIKIILLKHIPNPKTAENEPRMVEVPVKEFSDVDSITKVMGAIRDHKLSASFSNHMPQYVLRIEYHGKFDSDGHTSRSLLLWLSPLGQSSVIIDETEKGDMYTLSPDTTHILREMIE